MSSSERYAQILDVGRHLFAEKGYEAASVEEVANRAGISKPIVYEHFGGKEGLYAAIVNIEMQTLTDTLSDALSAPNDHLRKILEKATLALLTYIDEHFDGYTILTSDSPWTDPGGSFSSLLGTLNTRITYLLSATFFRWHIPVKGALYYTHMLIGMMAFAGQRWAIEHKITKDELAAYIVNFAWNGLSSIEPEPELRFKNEISEEIKIENPGADKIEAQTPKLLESDADTDIDTGSTDSGEDSGSSESIYEAEPTVTTTRL
jgi:AcrR family transcriptional regulator